MTVLDYDGRVALAELQRQHGVDTYQEVEPVSGTDEDGGLRLTLDAARRVVDVRVEVAERLRRPEELDRAVREAFASADVERAIASVRVSGRYEEYQRRGEERLSGARPLRVPTPPDVHYLVREAELYPGPGPDVPEPRSGRSENGYLTVHLTADGDLRTASVDEEWLSAASDERLERALLEAFAAARGAS